MDVLKEHPELAPDLLKVISDALKASQQQVQVLERRLADREQNASAAPLKPECCTQSTTKIAELEAESSQLRLEYEQQLSRNADLSAMVTISEASLERVQTEYDHEKSTWDETHTALETRYLSLRTKKVTVERESLRVVDEARRQKDEWSHKELAHQGAFDKLTAAYHELLNDRNSLQILLTEKTTQFDVQEAALAKSVTGGHELNEKLTKTQLRLAQTDARRAEAEAGRQQLEQRIGVAAIERDKGRQNIQTLISASEVERQSRTALETTLEAKDAEIHRLQGNIARLNEQLQTAAAASGEELTRLNDESAKHQALHEKYQRSVQRCTDGKALLLAHEATIAKLRGEVANGRVATDDLVQQLGRNTARSTELNKERDALLAKYTQLEGEHGALGATHEAAIAKLREENRNLRTSVLSAGTQAREQLQQHTDHERGQLQGTIKTHEEEIVRLQNELNSAQGLLLEEKNGRGTIESILDKQKEENVRLQQELDAVQNRYQSERGELENLVAKQNEEDVRLREELNQVKEQNSRVQNELNQAKERLAASVASEVSDVKIEERLGRELSDDSKQMVLPDRLARREYIKFMALFPTPAVRPSFQSLLPVQTVHFADPLDSFTHDLHTSRMSLHCPERMHWCGDDKIHAIIYHPTHDYWSHQQRWVTPPQLASFAGNAFDLFVTSGGLVYYVGVYRLHSLRGVSLPGGPVPVDVSKAAIQRATGVDHLPAGCPHPKVLLAEAFPDGELKTECFGLECCGFDERLYDVLRERFLGPVGGGNARKRRAGDEELREGGRRYSGGRRD
ncbi:hypothetical protein C8R46DRAFT_1341920 [Mycena filopes]|nr:hypothetical protein C8R46DRAFT_1341920 [Mycena filopes]